MELANAKPKTASKHTRRQVPSRIIEGTEARVELLRVVHQTAGQARGGKGKPSQPRAEPFKQWGWPPKKKPSCLQLPIFEFQKCLSL